METKIKIIPSLITLILLTPFVLAQQPPTDTDGNPLHADTTYYITTSPDHGGLALSIRDPRRDPCPPNVVQEPTPASGGLPLRIYPLDPNITLGADLNLMFLGATICVQSTVWRLGDPRTGLTYVRSNGVRGRPGPKTVRNWFKLERAGDRGYKVVYCPSVCSECRVECGDVGVVVENGFRWLVLGSGEPLVVAFRKAAGRFGPAAFKNV